ncbi:efflux RND transporter permease subunit [Alkalimonas collagenimarina]|uniref:Efflux RND transporter permease subunit n=1 Tax=Alkalimonas collagenimarina TaxID=400390 RepID=A0ABT9GW58_9GAMM|nr:efflux RND transporter permease subunit [Alkalimonas collagenimarina]MDP4535289.1 efflux RND transporter permease subunit [Alkalimonas collagenimarina]
MTLPEFFIRRHVMAVMMSAVLVLFGLIAYQDIGNDRVPNVDFPVISVSTSLSGADPNTVDASVTQFIERAVNTVPGIDNISSVSAPGSSTVNITFLMGQDINVAFSEVQTRVSEVVGSLPNDADSPVINKVEADSQPILWLIVKGDRTIQQLTEFARTTLRPQLEQINGVGEIRLGGSRNRRIRVELDADAMSREGIMVADVRSAIDNEHVLASGGFLVGGRQERMLRLDLEYHDVSELNQLVIARRGDRLVRLQDISTIVDGLTDFRRLARFNDEESVGLGVIKVAGANTVEVVRQIEQRLEQDIKPILPAGIELTISSDQSVFIKNMIDNLERTLLLALILAGLIMWLFLKNLRSTLLIVISIPVSLLAVTAVMFFSGYTLNSMTMLAILLLIGLVVDDAIVVLENIWRHREMGENDTHKAASIGANEVFTAVIASSLSLIAIFGSVIFMEGIIGRFFESFAVVVVFGVAVSTFVALTLIPMLCSRFLSVPKTHGPTYQHLEAAFTWMDEHYQKVLVWTLGHRTKVILGSGLAILCSLWLGAHLPAEFAPDEDEGQFVVNMRAPLGSSIHYMDEKVSEVEAILGNDPLIENYFVAIGVGSGGVNEAIAFVRLQPWDKRRDTQQQVMNRLNHAFADVGGVRIFTASQGMFGSQRGEPLQFYVRGTNLEQLSQQSEQLLHALSQHDGLGRIDMDSRLDQPELRLVVDRERAHFMGLRTSDVVQAVNIFIGGADVARFDDDFGGGERFRIRLKGRDDQFTTAADINRIWLRNSEGERIRLDAVASFEEGHAPAVISRYNIQYATPFYIAPDIPLSDAIELVHQTAERTLSGGYSIALTGQAEELGRTVQAMIFVFLVAVVLVYMVLASQFNSYLQPIIIMTAMPLAMMGAFIGLWVTGNSLNIYSMIGMVLLIGVVTKNSILLIDLTNQYRDKQGMSIDKALQMACPVRLRPVLMTSLTLILAMIPAAFDRGPGGQGNMSLAITVIFGMSIATVLTLLLVPTAYSVLEEQKLKYIKEQEKPQESEAHSL